MHKTTSFLAACLLFAACDGRKGDNPRFAAEREFAAFVQEKREATEKRTAELARTHARLAAIDPRRLITTDEVVRILKQRRASGDGTDTATWHVDVQRAVDDEPMLPESENVACTVHWRSSDAAGQTGAQGSFRIEVQGRRRWDLMLANKNGHLSDIGDDAVVDEGIPFALVDGLCLSVPRSSSPALALLVIRCAAPHLRQILTDATR